MTKARGKDAEFFLDGNDLSSYITNTGFNTSGDSEDVTTYGNASHRKRGTLEDGAISLDGFYEQVDDAATPQVGPRSIISPLVNTVVDFAYYPQGNASNLPVVTGNVLVQNYAETVPVAGHITWAAALERDGDWTEAYVA
jgi:hypothetical protein